MKKGLLLLILSLICLATFAQNFFITDVKNDGLDNAVRSAIQTIDSNYILVGFTGTLNNSWDSIGTFIVKIDKYGQVQEKKNCFISDSFYCHYNIFENQPNNFIATSLQSPENSTKGTNYFVFNKYDNILNLISTKKIKFPIDSAYISYNFTKKINSSYYFSGQIQTDNYSGFYVCKIYQDTVKIRVYYNIAFPYLNVLENGDIFITGNITDTSSYTYKGQIIKLDTNDLSFSNIYCIGSDDSLYLYPRAYLFRIDNNKYIFSSSLDSDYDNTFIILDSSFNALKQKAFITPFAEMGVAQVGMDFKYNDAIYRCNGNGSNTYNLIKTDTALNFIFEKQISFLDNYILIGLIATQDTGCLMLALRRDELMQIRAIKFDKDGNYQPANIEDYNIKISDFVVYPNPADKILNIKKAVQVKNANFLLYNSNGKMVLRKNITQNITNLNISNLNTGVYIYNFLQKGKITDKGKIIIK